MDKGKDDDYAHLNDDQIDLSDNDIDEMDELVDEVDQDLLYGADCVQDMDNGNTKHWVPRCPSTIKPREGMMFNRVEDAEEFYRDYAKNVGFDVRRSTHHKFARTKIIREQYYVCSREGFNQPKNSENTRNTSSNRVGCFAKFVIKAPRLNEAYKCTVFEERHNHDMIPYFARHLLKSNRKLNIGHQKFMLSCARANLGPVKSYKLLKEMVGGYCHVGAMQSDFKNFKRDLMSYINEADAQMVIDRFKKRKDVCSAFCFEYDVNEFGQLRRLFWCDPIARKNYAAFGDVISFDSTYRTNKYCMVFAPFTGMDNHKKSVTFACGLLMKEDIESYTWLFEKFQQSMDKDPRIMVTNQDPAMKIAIEKVFPQTRHRFCMWHIMEKVSVKVGAKKINSGRFRKTMGGLVWSDNLTITEFETGWKQFVEDYGLEKKPWFGDMYALRSLWVPAYFRDILLGSLIRTTSISESQNSFFGRYSNSKFSLVELLMNFETAMDSQRHNQLKNDVDSDTKRLEYKTPLNIEKHEAEKYTLRIFSEVQDEIYASCFYCSVKSETEGAEYVVYDIRESNGDIYKVEHRRSDGFTCCDCLMFTKIGIPCRHIFSALKSIGKEEIPSYLLLPRWLKGAAKKVSGLGLEDVLHQSDAQEENKALVSQVWSTMLSCIGVVQDNKEQLEDFHGKLIEIEKGYKQHDNITGENETTIDRMVESFAGVAKPKKIVVKPPAKAKNKGSGIGGRRIHSGKEDGIEKQEKKGKRKCRTCGEYAGHDSRNCKMNKAFSDTDSE